jgi:hypothetical protein
VLELSTAERVSERGIFFGIRACEVRTERNCTMQQVASTGPDGFLLALHFVLSQWSFFLFTTHFPFSVFGNISFLQHVGR